MNAGKRLALLTATLLSVVTAANADDAYDFDADPLGAMFHGQIEPLAENVLRRFERTRAYATSDFPLSPQEHATFRGALITKIYSHLNTARFQWGADAHISENYKADLLGSASVEGQPVDLYRLTVLETGDHVPLAVCKPAGLTEHTPAVILFSGHTSNSGLYDLFIDRNGYQKALGLELCSRGFITMGVEKLDSGYTSVRFQLGKRNVVEREPGGGGDDELEIATTLLNTGDHPLFTRQIMANLAAYDLLLSLPLVDAARTGAAGVSFGGWQAVHLALLRPSLTAIANYGGMWSYLEAHTAASTLEQFEGIADFSQSLPGIFLLGDQNRFVLAVAPAPMLMGYGELDEPYTEYKRYFLPVVPDQYDALGASDNIEIVTHSKGHEIPVEAVTDYLKRKLGL